MRHLFGGSPSDYAVERVGSQLLLRPESVGTVWDAVEDGSQITDLTDRAGSPVTVVTADSDGAVAFYGPDGVTVLYVDFGYGRRYVLTATDLGETLADFIADGGQPGGWATLDGTGTIPAEQLPPPVGDWSKHVASVAATPAEKARADYVCDGTADDVQIQAAIDAAKAAGGGSIVLSSGTFNLAARIVIEGADDVDVEIDIHLRGQGPKSTTLAAGPGLASAVHLSKVIRAHLSDFGVTVTGSSHGISSATTNGANSGHRSFWMSSFRNLQINGPWDGTHSGWGMHLGSPFRSVFTNIEMGGVGNGWRLYSEHADFNPGDCVITRTFVDSSGDNMTAYQVDSTTNTGVMNQIEFIMCEAIASGTGCTGIHITGTGGWGTTHTHWRGINLEDHDKLLWIEYGADSTFRFNHIQLRAAAGLTAFNFGANSFNNAVLSCGLLYAASSCTLYSDANTMEAAAPNRVENTRVYAETGATVTATGNPAGTTIRRGIIGGGAGTTTGIRHAPGALAAPNIVTLTDAATVATDASLGSHFRVTITANRALGAPTNPTDGQRALWEVTASGGARTLTPAGGAGGFAFGSDITALTATASGKTDLIGAIYSAPANAWRVVAYVKGY